MNNKEFMNQTLANQCGPDLMPYWISLEDLQLTKIPFGDIDLNSIPLHQTIKLQAKIAPMEEANNRYATVSTKYFSVKEAYYEDGLLMITTEDGRLFCSQDFSKEWNQKIQQLQDLDLMKLAYRACMEKGELFRPITMSVVKHMGFDLDAIDFPNNFLCHKRLRAVTTAIHDYIMANNIRNPEEVRADQIEGLKAAITKAVMDPVISRDRNILEQHMARCITSDIPLIYAPEVKFFGEHTVLPKKISESVYGRGTIVASQTPMANTNEELKEDQLETNIYAVTKYKDGYFICTEDAIISTVNCQDEWIAYLKIHAPEKIPYQDQGLGKPIQDFISEDGRLSYLDTRQHSWLDPEALLYGEVTEVSAEDMRMADMGKHTQAWLRHTDEVAALNNLYYEILVKAVDQGMGVYTINNGGEYHIVSTSGEQTPIEKEDIMPGMTIQIDYATQMFIEDCHVVNNELILIGPDMVFTERDVEGWARSIEKQRSARQPDHAEAEKETSQETNTREL